MWGDAEQLAHLSKYALPVLGASLNASHCTQPTNGGVVCTVPIGATAPRGTGAMVDPRATCTMYGDAPSTGQRETLHYCHRDAGHSRRGADVLAAITNGVVL